MENRTTRPVNPTNREHHQQEIAQYHEGQFDLIIGGKISRQEFVNQATEREMEYIKREDKLTRDPLCQDLLTAAQFKKRLEISLKDVAAVRGSIAVIMLDLDHFKTANDQYGHQVGDEILKEVEIALNKAASRRTDTVQRVLEDPSLMMPTAPYESSPILLNNTMENEYPAWTARKGGDEFVLSCPYTNVQGALLICSHAQENFVKQLATRVKNKEDIFFPNSLKYKVTMSCGIAVCNFLTDYTDEERERINYPQLTESLILQADDALYTAKKWKRGSLFLYDSNDPRVLAHQRNREQELNKLTFLIEGIRYKLLQNIRSFLSATNLSY